MPRPKQTREQREAMRERIIDAAGSLLKEEGFDAVSIRAIAERVGVSHMVLYTYFKNRDTLIEALRERQRQRMRVWHAEMVQQAKTGDVVAAVRQALEHYAIIAREHPEMYKFVWVHPLTSERTFRHSHCHLENNVRRLAELIEQGIKRGVFVNRDPTLAAVTVFAIVNAPLILYHNGRLTDPEMIDRLVIETQNTALGYLMELVTETKN